MCDHYATAQELYQQGSHLVSTDEKTGIQALERTHPTRPMIPGKVELREFEYIRHGTQTLIANFEVATGQLITPSIGPTRTEVDFVAHIGQTIAVKVTGAQDTGSRGAADHARLGAALPARTSSSPAGPCPSFSAPRSAMHSRRRS